MLDVPVRHSIACGNTFVLKPSEQTPILANRLAELFQEAWLPDGVLNVVHGAHDVVNGLLEHGVEFYNRKKTVNARWS